MRVIRKQRQNQNHFPKNRQKQNIPERLNSIIGLGIYEIIQIK
jgi:hypothetical protein